MTLDLPDWTDDRPPPQYRAPVTIIGNYYNYLGPHPATVRASYTVPANRMFELMGVDLNTESGGGYATGQVFIETRLDAVTPGGVETIELDAYLWQLNAAGTRDEKGPWASLWLPAGAKLYIITFDGGASGNSYHFATVTGIEHDA